MFLPQVPCHRFDRQSRFKSWFFKIIAIGPVLLAYGSTKDKAMSRALGGDGAMEDMDKAVPIIACEISCLDSSRGRANILVIKTSADSSCDQIFSFESPDARDNFVRLLQVHTLFCSAHCNEVAFSLNIVLLNLTSLTFLISSAAPVYNPPKVPFTHMGILRPVLLYLRSIAADSGSRTVSTTGSLWGGRDTVAGCFCGMTAPGMRGSGCTTASWARAACNTLVASHMKGSGLTANGMAMVDIVTTVLSIKANSSKAGDTVVAWSHSFPMVEHPSI